MEGHEVGSRVSRIRREELGRMEKKTSVPKNFQVSSEIIALAKARGWPDPNEQLEEFMDWHKAHASLFADWDAALRNWLRKTKKFNDEKAGKVHTKDPKPVRSMADREPSLFDPLPTPSNGKLSDEQIAAGRAILMDEVKKLTKKFSIGSQK